MKKNKIDEKLIFTENDGKLYTKYNGFNIEMEFAEKDDSQKIKELQQIGKESYYHSLQCNT